MESIWEGVTLSSFDKSSLVSFGKGDFANEPTSNDFDCNRTLLLLLLKLYDVR